VKYLTFSYPNESAPDQSTTTGERISRLGVMRDELVIDLPEARAWAINTRRLLEEDFPDSLYELILSGPAAWMYAKDIVKALDGENPLEIEGSEANPIAYPLSGVRLLPPLPRLVSLRDFYAFEKHVAVAHANRGKQIPPEWYQFPVYYFSNPNSIYGSYETIPCPTYTQELDYELEVACILGKTGMDIRAEEAEDYIFGYTVLNDWSARDIQKLEMRVGLGPAKGKDFASSLGPWIVTPDELAEDDAGRPGVFDRLMTAKVNGEERSRGNWREIYYSFGEMIARASQGVHLLPGEVIGSGTVGSGCLLELTKGQGPWLQVGDVVELEIEGLGKLVNRVGPPLNRNI
jgi:fumarylacetoacetate (FAA) hydrolase